MLIHDPAGAVLIAGGDGIAGAAPGAPVRAAVTTVNDPGVVFPELLRRHGLSAELATPGATPGAA